MKRKNLEKAIVLGLILSTGACGSAWAERMTINDGSETDIASEAVNGEYNHDYVDENIIIDDQGLIAVESDNPLVEKFTLKTTGDFNVSKSTVEGAGGSGPRSAIDFYDVNYKLDGNISAHDINLTQTFFPSDGGGVQGIELKTKGNLTENITLDLNASNNVNFYNFDESITLNKNTELYITAGQNIKFDIDKSSNWNRFDYATGIRITGGANNTNKDNSDVDIELKANNIVFNNMYQAINFAGNNINMDIIANEKIKIENVDGSRSNAIQFDNKNFYNDSALQNNEKTIANLVAGENITIDNYRTGIYSSSDFPSFTLGSEINLYSNKIDITNTTVGISASSDRYVTSGDNNIVKLDDYDAYKAEDDFERNNINTISASEKALNATDKAGIILNAATNRIVGAEEAVFANRTAEINVNGKENYIANSFADEQTGNGSYALHSQNEAKIIVEADEINNIIGDTEAVLAEDGGIVNISGKNNYIANSIGKKSDITTFNDKENYALHAKDGGNISVTADEGGINQIYSDSFRTIHASGGDDGGSSNININGAVEIINNNALNNAETNKIAVVASADENTSAPDAIGGIVNIDLNGTGTEVNSNGQYISGNVIFGSVIAGQNGTVNINKNLDDGDSVTARNNSNGSIAVYGNVMAGNNGELNLGLGEGGYLVGRVDDYQDAGLKNSVESGFFNPEFSKEVTSSGTVNLDLGNGSIWNLTGQSWVTELSGNGTVILVGDDTENGALAGTGGYAVHIGTLKGNNTFVVNLQPDELENSDMIYIQNGTADKQTLVVNNERDLIENKDWERIRFATVADAQESFEYGGAFGDTYSVKGRGVRNVDYSLEYVDMDEDTTSADDEKKYNGGKEFYESDAKPGTDYTEEVYNKTDEGKNSQNIYLVRSGDPDNPGGEVTDSGKTIINMSRANYKNAIYMDRLNKRMGEMRYVNGEEEQGLWVRLRHDRIGQSGDFRSMNTMYEVGYDVKQPTDNGEHRIGMAIDYMRGSTTYDDIMGKGETKRYGLWLYDTWLGEKGHYTDYIVKWGHLSNDFDIRDKDSLENITGDYSNNVFSVSAEYGKKNDMGNNWYFEPQAQLQLARVTGADYVTTQGSKVNVDGINSLIGRAGFRIGRDMDENSTVYLKADLLHEFMGDQTVTAADATGTLREEFENKGTWYDVGFGFAAKMSKNSYAFMDFEKSFGNDNDETYQINAGMQWTF